MSGADDKRFADVREQLAEWERQLEALRGAHRLWLRVPATDGSAAQVMTLPAGQRPDDPAFVLIPVASPENAESLALLTQAAPPLTAFLVGHLLPVMAQAPGQVSEVTALLREQLGGLVAHLVERAEEIARQQAALGLLGTPPREDS